MDGQSWALLTLFLMGLALTAVYAFEQPEGAPQPRHLRPGRHLRVALTFPGVHHLRPGAVTYRAS